MFYCAFYQTWSSWPTWMKERESWPRVATLVRWACEENRRRSLQRIIWIVWEPRVEESPKRCFVQIQYSGAVWFHFWLYNSANSSSTPSQRSNWRHGVAVLTISVWPARMRLEYNYINWPRIQKQLDEVIFAYFLSKIVFSKLAASKRLQFSICFTWSNHSRYSKNGCGAAQKTALGGEVDVSGVSRKSSRQRFQGRYLCGSPA